LVLLISRVASKVLGEPRPVLLAPMTATAEVGAFT
jgi:hypothetical protein